MVIGHIGLEDCRSALSGSEFPFCRQKDKQEPENSPLALCPSSPPRLRELLGLETEAMPPSAPFRPPRSARDPALESVAEAKRAPHNLPQTASKSAYGTISSTVAASPGAARVKKLNDECEQLMMQLGCVLSLSASLITQIARKNALTLHFSVVHSGADAERLYVLGGVNVFAVGEDVRGDAVALPFDFSDAESQRMRKRSAKYVFIHQIGAKL